MDKLQIAILVIISVGCLQAQVTAPPGAQGPKGAAGPQGAPGVEGPQGDTGEPGDGGEQGPSGEQGSPGATGASGEQGLPGPKGEQGAAGDFGVLGEFGEKGLPGETGDKGANGATGTSGRPGAVGPKGDKGDRGDRGINGISGELGAKGEKGAIGIIGASGERGDQGPVGLQGYSLADLDIDECASAISNDCDPTSTKCVNWATGYRCTCKKGYKAINGSNNVCQDINECEVENGGCAGACINSIGSFECNCPSSTLLTANNQCADINECDDSLPCGTDPDVYCINNYNGYSCISSKAPGDEGTTAAPSAAQQLSLTMNNNTWIIVLLIWFSVLTFIAIIVLIWLIHVFHKMKKDRARRRLNNSSLYDTHGPMEVDDDEDIQFGPEGMTGSEDIHLDLPRPPRSHRGTMKGAAASKGSLKGSRRSYKGGSRPGSVSSSTGSELRTASIKPTRVATGERSSANRLSGVDTFY